MVIDVASMWCSVATSQSTTSLVSDRIYTYGRLVGGWFFTYTRLRLSLLAVGRIRSSCSRPICSVPSPRPHQERVHPNSRSAKCMNWSEEVNVCQSFFVWVRDHVHAARSHKLRVQVGEVGHPQPSLAPKVRRAIMPRLGELHGSGIPALKGDEVCRIRRDLGCHCSGNEFDSSVVDFPYVETFFDLVGLPMRVSRGPLPRLSEGGNMRGPVCKCRSTHLVCSLSASGWRERNLAVSIPLCNFLRHCQGRCT